MAKRTHTILNAKIYEVNLTLEEATKGTVSIVFSMQPGEIRKSEKCMFKIMELRDKFETIKITIESECKPELNKENHETKN